MRRTACVFFCADAANVAPLKAPVTFSNCKGSLCEP